MCSLAHCQPSMKISRKSVRKFLREVANRQTDKQINNDKNISSLAETIISYSHITRFVHISVLYVVVQKNVTVYFSNNWVNKSSAVAEMGDRLAAIDMGLKVGGCCAPFREGSWPTSVPSGIVVHPTFSPRYTNVTDRTKRQDRHHNSLIAWRTVTCNGRPKTNRFY